MPTPYAIFCTDPLNPPSVETNFADEATAARDAGFAVVCVDHDALDRHSNAQAALRKARFDGPGFAVYRGWMMSVAAYKALYSALSSRDITLLTTPQDYEACHHAPASYSAMMEWMPKTVWLDKTDIDDREALLSTIKPFGNSALILKDWVKSQASGYWAEACFIPDASDPDAVIRVVERFRELQGDSLVGGLVFKEYLRLTPPQCPPYEYRAFMFRGQVLGCWPRSDDAGELGAPPLNLLNEVASRMPSPFASADFGCDMEGRWWLLEVGDGQVSGLPTAAATSKIFLKIFLAMASA